MTTGKMIPLTRRTFVGKVMSLLFNMLSRLVITFLPRSMHLLISWLQSPSAVIFEPRKIKSLTISTVSPSICHEVMGPDAMILVFWMFNVVNEWTLCYMCLLRSWFTQGLCPVVLEKEMAIHSSTLAWKTPWMEEPGRLQSMGLQRVRHDWVTSLHFTSWL